MSAGAVVLTGYFTFVGRRRSWRLYRGVGTRELVAERGGAPAVLDVAAADRPILWLSCRTDEGDAAIECVRLPELASETIPWTGGRIGAVATCEKGERAVVLELPDDVDDRPRLSLWSSSRWRGVEMAERPHVSSTLAWLGGDRVAFESAARRLAVVDLGTGDSASGPPGSSPTAARRRREWFALKDGKVLALATDRPFEQPPRTVEGFDFGAPSRIRFTSDGRVCAWTEPRFVKQLKGYVQVRGEKRRRLKELDDGIAVVVGEGSEGT